MSGRQKLSGATRLVPWRHRIYRLWLISFELQRKLPEAKQQQPMIRPEMHDKRFMLSGSPLNLQPIPIWFYFGSCRHHKQSAVLREGSIADLPPSGRAAECWLTRGRGPPSELNSNDKNSEFMSPNEYFSYPT